MEKRDKIIEEIGNIKLDLSLYSGEDLYCDGDIEDTLLTIARDRAQVEYQKIIEESKSWPILYHLSPLRENIVEWLPITKDMKVLEVGSGCGAITGALARKAGTVTCVDLSKKRSLINAYRHMDADNVTIHVGNFMDIEGTLDRDYDMICLIGVFEYGQAYTGGETPYEDLLNIIKAHIKPNGRIAIAIENKFGLKYWAGCREDHLGAYFAGLEDYPNGGVVRTFTNDGLIQIAKKCGFSSAQMFYPYPDYKFMVNLYSDKRLPLEGELKNNLNHYDRDRLLLFNEKNVFDNIIREKKFPLFSNSYMMILGPEIELDYVRYSNDRDESYGIKTVMRHINGQPVIEKHALNAAANQHIENIQAAYRLLSNRYEGGKLKMNQCEMSSDKSYISLEYVKGVSLEKLLDECIQKGDEEGFLKLFSEYFEAISYGKEKEKTVTDYDLIFSNILIDGEDWTVIDYEWTFAQNIDPKDIAYRAIYCYKLEDVKRANFDWDKVYEMIGIKAADVERLQEQEAEFQKMVTGKRLAMIEIRDAIGNAVHSIDNLDRKEAPDAWKNRIQIYEDTGYGFHEEQSFFIEDDAEDLDADVSMPHGSFYRQIVGNRKALRIDPCSDYCIVYVKEIKWNNMVVTAKNGMLTHNGVKLGVDLYGFDTEDPNFTISFERLDSAYENDLFVEMEITRVPEATAKQFRQKKGLFGFGQ